MSEIQKNSLFKIKTYDGQVIEITDEQKMRMESVLLKTGKFIKIGEDITNISDIRGISKTSVDDVSVPDYLKPFKERY